MWSDPKTSPDIYDVTPDTLPALDEALAHLSQDLGDTHRITQDVLHETLFGAYPAAHAALARTAQGHVGAVLYSPVISTVTGTAGTYVSDLWVAPDARGQAVGRALLGYVARRAHDFWQARFIRLVTYADNAGACAFYTRLGFTENIGQQGLQLSGDALDQLKESR